MKLLFFILFVFSFTTYSQDKSKTTKVGLKPRLLVTIYKTHADYVKDSGVVVGTYMDEFSYLEFPKSFKIWCKQDSTRVKYRLTDYWGFSIGYDLFRLYKACPYHVYKIGDIVYYESGIAKLRSYDDGLGWDDATFSVLARFSLNFTSNLLTSKQVSTLYKNDRPDLRLICDCIQKSYRDAHLGDPLTRYTRYIEGNRKCFD